MTRKVEASHSVFFISNQWDKWMSFERNDAKNAGQDTGRESSESLVRGLSHGDECQRLKFQ
ncbi:hypothetical protein, partial [Aeromonas salmonicida]